MWQGVDGRRNNDVTKDILILIPRTDGYVRIHGKDKELLLKIKLGF